MRRSEETLSSAVGTLWESGRRGSSVRNTEVFQGSASPAPGWVDGGGRGGGAGAGVHGGGSSG